MVDHATAEYLSENVGGVLGKALAEMAVQQPSDGVAFLASWLKVYVDQEEAKGRQELEQAQLAEARAKAAAQREEQAAKKAASEQQAAAKEKTIEDTMSKFGKPETTFEEPFWTELLSAAASMADAKGAYLGLQDDEGLVDAEGPLIRYTAALPGSELVLEKVLGKDQGVSWGAVTENPSEEVKFLYKPPQPEPVEANPEDPDAPPPEPTTLPYYPVSVQCVTDVAEVHYFDMARLGAYVAVPLVYNSYHTPEAHAAAKTYEEEKKAKKVKYEEAKAAYEAQVAEATATGGEDAAAEVPKPPELEQTEEEKPMELPGKTVRMLLCVDTLGLNTAIEETKIDRLMELCKAFVKCKEETEKRQVDAQALGDIDEVAKEELSQAIMAARLKAEEDMQDQLTLEESEAADELKEVVQKKFAYLRATKVFAEMKDEFLKLTSWVVAPAEMMSLIACAAYMYGYKKADLYPKRKANMTWETLLKILDGKFCDAIKEADIAAPRKGLDAEQKLAAIKAALPADFDAEKAKAVSLRLELLHAVLDSAIAYRTADLMAKKAAHEKLKAENAELEEPADPPPPLEGSDDDFEGLA